MTTPQDGDPGDAPNATAQRDEPSAPPLSPLRRPEFRNLFAISITVTIGFGMVIPVLPLFARSFGVGLAAIGLVQVVFGLMRFSFGLVGGLVVDRFGERACTIAGLLIVSLSSYGAGLSSSFTELIVARGLGGAGSALFINGLMTRILRIIEPEAMGRATGAFRSSFLIGIGAGPVLGGVLAERYGLQAPFFFYGTGLIVASVIAWFVMTGETRAAAEDRKSPLEALRVARPLLRDLRYVVALAATFVGWWTISGPAGTVGVVFADEKLGFDAGQIGFGVTLLAVGEILALFIAGRAADIKGRRAVLVPSLVLCAVTTIIVGHIEPFPWAFYVLLMGMGAGVAASSTASGGLLADSIPEGGSGTAVGVNQMAGDLGYLLAPVTIGAIVEATSFEIGYAAAAVPAVLVFFFALRLPRGPVAAVPRAGDEEPGVPVG